MTYYRLKNNKFRAFQYKGDQQVPDWLRFNIEDLHYRLNYNDFVVQDDWGAFVVPYQRFSSQFQEIKEQDDSAIAYLEEEKRQLNIEYKAKLGRLENQINVLKGLRSES